MKKMQSILLAGLLVLSLAACDSAGSSSSEAPDGSSSQPAGPETSTISEDSAPAGGTGSSMLVVYFSYAENAALPEDADVQASASIQHWNDTLTGNTGVIAQMIAEQTRADLFSLRTEELYPDTYEATIDQGQQEQSEGARPALQSMPENLEQYDVIFLGYPDWWGDMPMAVYTFLDGADLSGKTLVPFVTSGGSGFADTLDTLARLEPEAEIQNGLSVRNTEAAQAEETVAVWLTGLGYLSE